MVTVLKTGTVYCVFRDDFDVDGQLDSIAPEARSNPTARRRRNHLEFFKIVQTTVALPSRALRSGWTTRRNQATARAATIAARIIRSASPARWPTAARNTVVVSASPARWPIVARKTVVVKLKVF